MKMLADGVLQRIFDWEDFMRNDGKGIGEIFGHAGEDCADLVVLKVLGFNYADDVAEIEAARNGGGLEDAVYVL